jgi:hypothetical protein
MLSDEALLTGRVVIVVEMTCWVAEAAALLVVVAASLVTATLALLVVALTGVALAVFAALDPVLVESAFAALLLLALIASVLTALLEVLVAVTSADTGWLVTSIPNAREHTEIPMTAQFLPHLYNL